MSLWRYQVPSNIRRQVIFSHDWLGEEVSILLCLLRSQASVEGSPEHLTTRQHIIFALHYKQCPSFHCSDPQLEEYLQLESCSQNSGHDNVGRAFHSLENVSVYPKSNRLHGILKGLPIYLPSLFAFIFWKGSARWDAGNSFLWLKIQYKDIFHVSKENVLLKP